MEKYYLNGQRINKQTLNKYIKWSRILTAIKGGCDNRELLKQRFGLYAKDCASALKADGMMETFGKGIHAYYKVTDKGEQIINDIKQYEKEKKENEKI